MEYYFAIDETGRFGFSKDDESYVCGVLILKNEKTMEERYRDAYVRLGFDEVAPHSVRELLGDKKFHFSELPDSKRQICREILFPLADKIFVSTGKPLLWANNQNFWFIAVASVIFELFKNCQFQKSDRLNIVIDHRSDKVWGMFAENNEEMPDFNKYHADLKKQIDKLIEPLKNNLGIEVTVKFAGDTKSFFVNLADIVCGLVRKDESINTIKCSCESVMSGDNPVSIMDKNPIGALNVILAEILNNRLENINLISSIFKKTKSDNENYAMIWNLFHNFLRYQLDTRYSSKNTISKLNNIVNKFLNEFHNNTDKITVDKRLEIINSFMAYYSHAGEITIPIGKDYFIKLLNETDNKAESRVIRKWEIYVSYCLHEAQIQFNAYNFSEAIKICEEIWKIQEEFLKLNYPFDAKKDEPTTAVIGTLAQSYAFDKQIDKAIEYFEMSQKYAIKTSAQTASYLLSLYFIKQNIENVRKYFELQTGKKPEAFTGQQEIKDVWEHLSYSKLRALELYKNQKTDLPEIPITDCNKEYPYPLVLKWVAVAKYLENPTENKQIVSDYLSKAIENLLNNKGGFTIKTLSLPIIQIYALIDNTDPYHAKYNSLMSDLKKQSGFFADFVEKQSPLLNQIKNDADIWERATSLPFNYS